MTDDVPYSTGSGAGIEIRVWSVDRATERDDLTIPLRECGTGIGQALAVLYILVNSEEPRTIIIDEPQSFLHSGAAKKLMDLLNQHPQHQYFVSTHSPEILAAAKPATITALEYRNSESTAKGLTLDQTDELRTVLNEIGFDFSDVFFAENILWVEGPTEASAFPLIAKKFLGSEILSRITILPLAHTGDLQAKKNARLVFEIYKRLSGAHALVPPVIGTILDCDQLAKRGADELKRLGGDLLTFLARTCYENYLLIPEAISYVANKQENFCEPALTPEQVSDFLKKMRESGEFLPDDAVTKGSSSDQKEWLCRVDGARLLSKVFSQFSETRVSYQKTTHSIQLTKWLLENEQGDLHEIAGLIKTTIERKTKATLAAATVAPS